MTDSSTNLKSVLSRIANAEQLEEHETESVFEIIMSGEATNAQIAAILMGMRIRGETINEITGAARIMRSKALHIEAPKNAIDTCGTGGDNSGTYNISTGAAIVAASCGIPVAKHGNRALSSKSGSADVLKELGVNIDANISLLEKSLSEANICFMMAPHHHNAMKHVAAVRGELGTRTIFNLLGPLSNPAGTTRQLVGVFSKKWVEPLAKVLGNLGCEHAWVVHGHDGLDEITTTGSTYIAEYKNGTVNTFEIKPQEFDLQTANPEDLKGGDPKFNAKALHDVFAGNKNPLRDIILLNASAAMVVGGKYQNIKDAINFAAAAVDNGKALKTLEKMIDISKGNV